MSKLNHPPTVVLWGQPSRQTAVTLFALVRAGVPIQCLVLARADRSAGPLVQSLPTVPWQTDPAGLARRVGIPTIPVAGRGRLHELAREPAVEAECGVVSCFPWKLPPALIDRYPLGMFNIHPAPLPDYRGPSPLFWQYRDGRLETGVTVHRLTDDLDAGPIVACVRSTLPLAFPGDRLEAWLAWYGTSLLLRFWQEPSQAFPPERQPRLRPWAPVPRAEDTIIDKRWEAWRVAHFLAGALPLGFPILVRDDAERIWRIHRFLAWTAQPLVSSYDGRCLSLPFGRSWITVEASRLHSEERVRRSTFRQ